VKSKITYLFTLALVALASSRVMAQAQDTPFLERTLTLALHDERLDNVLKRISRQGGFTFSYSPSILQGDKIVNYNFVNKTVREILDQLFQGTIQYKARGKYIILTKAMVSSSPKEPQLYSGYVVDEATGERLKHVSIYDPVTLSSTISDSYGYFEIEIDKPAKDLRLAINKQNYTDTLVVVPSPDNKLLNIPMRVNTARIATLADSVGKKLRRFWKNSKLFAKGQTNIANINDTIYRKTQVSFVPFIGTNHALSGNVINDYSLNVVGGYSMGVRKLELGSVFNIVRGNVQGVQMAGTFNAVGGKVKGVQMAGVINANYGTMEGAQLAGVLNFNWGEVRYFSAAGVMNFAGHGSRAVQLAGVGNITIGNQESPHLAGLFNLSTGNAKSQIGGVYNFAAKDVHGAQAAGILNLSAKNVAGAQTAGVLNFAANEVQGAQVAGILNFTGKRIRGAQVAGVLNYATRVEGAQIGLVNITDSIRGVPIGLLSIVLKGYHKLEVAADEVFYTNVAFRTGVRRFYNIITAGARPSTFDEEETFWTFGYGIGTAPRLSKKLFLNLDVTSNQIVQGNTIEALNMINKAYLGVDFQMMKNISITAGATLNAHFTETTYDGYKNFFTDYQPNVFYNKNVDSDLNVKMWIGGKIGVRFF
jgi:hypothetical protein